VAYRLVSKYDFELVANAMEIVMGKRGLGNVG
jgi:hypothetical protein